MSEKFTGHGIVGTKAGPQNPAKLAVHTPKLSPKLFPKRYPKFLILSTQRIRRGRDPILSTQRIGGGDLEENGRFP